MSFRSIFFCYFLFLFAVTIHSQEIPPIKIFTPEDYGAEDQNWSITQADNNFIYIANNKGLLEYNGASWQLYDSPNESIIRSVKVVDDRVYSGSYMDFGFWTKNSYNQLTYKSLAENQDFSIKEDEDFWSIIEIEGYILFKSFDRIYIYDTTNDSFEIIDSDIRINKIFKVNESIYFQKLGEGIFEIINGNAKLVVSSEVIKKIEIINIFDYDKGLLLQTKENGFYTYKNNVIEKWKTEADELLSDVSIYSSIKLKSGDFILGTISNGIIQLSDTGKILLKIDHSEGLSNNTILSVKEDNNGNVWLGLDNGVNVVNLKSPYKVYKDEQGILGTVYTSAIVDNYLYLGTNQGLFYRAMNSKEKFKFTKGTQGQVWFLKYIKGKLFCGHDRGTFIIENNIAKQISPEIGTWIVKPIESNKNLLLQGNYKGLFVLELVNGTWQYRNKIEGFDISSRFVEFSAPNELLVNHEYKGVYKLTLNHDYTRVLNYKKLPIDNGIKSSLLKYNDTILYCYEPGVYSFDEKSDTFKKDSVLSNLFTLNPYLSGRLIYDERHNRLWGFSKDKIVYVEPEKLSDKLEIKAIEINDDIRKIKSGFENLLSIDGDEYLFGNKEGYIVANIKKQSPKNFKIYLNEASYASLQSSFIPIDFSQPINLDNKDNSLRFSYSVPNYDKLSISKYQYKLNGIYDQWSDWSTNSDVLFENLPHGNYEFVVRAKVGSVSTSNTISYSFSIDKPWYLKSTAIIAYALLFLLFLFFVQYLNKKHYEKQQQKLLDRKERERELELLENQRQIVEFKNKNLQLDIDNKNRELGTATMNLVRRNELLNDIKDKLSKSKSLDEVKGVIKMINSSLNNTSDWKLFEEAFNNVDKDFMKKVKSLHPSITTNDLRLCAYLRLNLSSKEIAPLLNISHKSVEVKRYRLRKKMGLDHEQSLTNYILDL
ncbi:triple tyrosine motif-containing protein [Winogradskyella sp.]|uniref:triple tyrosine motif-containing protein n=2 Tax=Winogradskyella sp. TaxID=1883156 RepID=UPI003513F2EC